MTGSGYPLRDCHGLLCLIADLGWDDRVPQPLCIEIDNGDGNEEFNQRIVNSCPDGEFGIPAFQPNSIRYASSAALTPTLHFDVACIKCHTRIQTRP